MSSNALRLIQSEYESESDSNDPQINISSESSSSSWSLSSDEDINNDDNESNGEDIESNDKTFKQKNVVKTKGELSLEDLPPIEKLSISVGVEELSQLGRVVSIVDQLVIVQSFRSMPALDLDSVLFLKDGQPLGQIFDVFGPVVEPRYAVRFNDIQEITERNITVETAVYFAAEQQLPITGFVFAEQLRQMKGSDASWKHNNEPPEDVVEYSDDEMERQHKQKERAKRSRNQTIQRPQTYHSRNYRVPPNTPIGANFGQSPNGTYPNNSGPNSTNPYHVLTHNVLNHNYFQL